MILNSTHLKDVFKVPSSQLLHARNIAIKFPNGSLSKSWGLSVPPVQGLDLVIANQVENMKKIDKSHFPNSKLKFVHEIGGKHLIKVEAMFSKLDRECALKNI